SSRRRHTRFSRDWSSDVCSSDLPPYRKTASIVRESAVRRDLRHARGAAMPGLPCRLFSTDPAMRLATLAFALLATLSSAHAAEPITLAQAMADPDWIGPPVESMWWRWDGKAAQYTLKRGGADVRDNWQVAIDGGVPALVDDGERADLDAAGAVLDAAGA